jgi:DNA-directed RNA polymerase subunit RPC12/RpoP
MSEYLEKCSVCSALVDEEDLFCANCGTEAPQRERDRATLRTQTFTHNFLCEGCGASMSYDASAQTLRCPFCGSERLSEQQDTKMVAPERIVPFAIDHQQATRILRQWLGRGFWRPGDLASASVVTKITPVYVPYWVFQAHTHTYWSADTSHTPPGARGDWYPLFGEHRSSYSGLLIGASGVLTPGETSSLCPFELAQARPAAEIDTENMIVEQFRVQRKYARPLAHQGLEELERNCCQQYVPGSCRNMKANLRLEGLSSEPVLLPVWIMAYRYKDAVYRFLINGQMGHAAGHAPFSWAKLALVIAIVAIIALVIFLGMIGVAAVAERPGRSPTAAARVVDAKTSTRPVAAANPECYGSRTDLRW